MQVVECWYKSEIHLEYPIWRNVFVADTPNEASEDALRSALQWFMRAVGYLHRNDVALLFATARPYGLPQANPATLAGVSTLPQIAFPAGMRPIQTPCPEWFGLAATNAVDNGFKGHHWFFGSLNEEDIVKGFRGGYHLKNQAAFDDILNDGFNAMLDFGAWQLYVNQHDGGRDRATVRDRLPAARRAGRPLTPSG